MNPLTVSVCSNEPLKIEVVTHFMLTTFSTNECDDLPYFASICQDMYRKTMSRGIVKILDTKMKCANYGKSWHSKAF